MCGKIFALFQACVCNFDTIPLWKVDRIFYLDSSCVTLKYFGFLSVCDKFELIGRHDALSVVFAVLRLITGYCQRFYRIILAF